MQLTRVAAAEQWPKDAVHDDDDDADDAVEQMNFDVVS